jgi:hypothetical protein
VPEQWKFFRANSYLDLILNEGAIMEHLIASLVLPVFVLVVLAKVIDVKAEAILMPLFAVVGVILKLVIDLAVIAIGLTSRAVVILISRLLNAR